MAAESQGASTGLPQFQFEWWAGEIFWLIIIFGALFLVFWRIVVPRVGGTIALREDKISGDIGDARRLRDEAEAQAKTAAEELAQARARAQKLAADAKAAANAVAARRQAEEEARLGQLMSDAEARINAARAEAMTQVRGIAGDTASAIVQRLTGGEASPAEVERALASLG